MGRRRRNDIDELLDAWARWCASGGLLSGGGASMLARMIDNQGLIIFGSSGPSTPMDAIEARIEAVVIEMAQADQLQADVLRLEYVAGWWGVVKRRRIKNYDPRGTDQAENAAALGVSVRTYRRRLAQARDLIRERLES